jgi:hypothetical protein
MKTIHLSQIIFLAFLITAISCSKDDDKPGDQDGPSVTETIDATGGIIEFNDIVVDIPAGAFDGPQEIKVIERTESSEAFDDIVSKTYRLDGLPATINEDIQLSLNFVDMEGEEKVVLEYEGWIKGISKVETISAFLETTSSESKLQATIKAFDALSGLADDEISTRDQTHWFDISAIGGFIEEVSAEGHFLVHSHKIFKDEAIALAGYLEEAYDQFKDMGFDFSKRSEWPVEVTVKKLEQADRFGQFCGSLRGPNYTTLEMNSRHIDQSESVRVTAGHEFFHLVQDWYDSRTSWQKIKEEHISGPRQLWLDEAMSTWSEQFFSTKSRFAPLLLTQNFPDALAGGYQAYGTESQKQAYGYGLAGLIEYIHKDYGGDATIVKIYEDFEKTKDAVRAVNKVFLSSLGGNWPRFLEDLMEFELFPYQEGTSYSPERILTSLSGSDGFFTVNQPTASQTFNFNLPDLSAKTFMVRNQSFTGFDPDALLTFDVLNNEDAIIQVYRTHRDRNTSEKIAEGTDIVSIPDFANHISEGYVIGALVINTDDDIPFDGSEDVSMKISIAEPITFNQVEVSVFANGVIEVEERDDLWDVDTSYIRLTTNLNSLPFAYAYKLDHSTTVTGSTYTTIMPRQSNPPIDWAESVFVSTFDDPSDPAQLDMFEYNCSWETSDTVGGYGKVTRVDVHARLKNIPYDRFDPLNNYYSFRGDVGPQQIDFAEYTMETIYYKNGAVNQGRYKKESLRTFDNGSASILFHKE